VLDKILAHIRRLFQAHEDLAEALPEAAFGQKLSTRSNTIGGQFWCVVGARESYTRALERGGWAGFSCSLSAEASRNKGEVIQALKRTTAAFDGIVQNLSWTDAREHLLVDLLEHETQHQGQLIRYVYGLGHTFPKSWAKRWALSE
jgi:uncharacterized damage-inducible protein DinB